MTLCAPLDTLPFRSDSIDAILLPHTLELVEDPYAVLREAERVLTGEGCLMICGFNPFSGWGARRVFGQYFGRPAFPPHTQRMLSERRLRDWVALLGFDVDSVHGYLGFLPVTGAHRRDPAAALLDRGGLLAQGPQARVDSDVDPPAPTGAPAGAGRRGGTDQQSAFMREVDIFTDGACRGNPGPGGWAALLVAGDERKEVSGSEAMTTNNRMELSAAIGGLERLKAALRGEAVHRFEIRASGHHRMAAELEGARLAHRGARARQESGSLATVGRGRRQIRIFSGFG